MITYDDFSSETPSPTAWQVARAPLDGGNFWTFADANAVISCRAKRCMIDIPRFSLRNDYVQIFDNPKLLYLSTHVWPTAMGPLTFRTTMTANVSGNPDDYRDGFVSLNVLDFATGMLFDVASNGHHLWAVYERLLIPGAITEEQAFTEVIDLGVDTAPDREHEVGIVFDGAAGKVEYLVDGKLCLTREGVPVLPQTLMAGFGIVTLHPIQNGESVSCRGQGAKGSWGSYEVSAPGVPIPAPG
jgi:hypothetical protein